jgi:TolA-binding protein
VGILAIQQSSTASKWRKADNQAIAQLALAHTAIKSLNSQISQLNGHITSLNSQLSAIASAKEKALDQNTLLAQTVSAAGAVSSEVSTCVDDLNLFLSTLGTDLEAGDYTDPTLTEEENTASSTCTKAQSDNQSLQTVLSGSGG